MFLSMVTPGKYLQGKNILEDSFEHLAFMGTQFAVIVDPMVKSIVSPKLEKSFVKSSGLVTYELIDFNGESTEAEATRIKAIIEKTGSQGVIGIGGGKVIDTAKLVANLAEKPLGIIPTSASSDAPCSGISVIYNEEGVFQRAERMKRNPDIVLVDTDIIARAPKRLLVAGIGDAIATYYEAKACWQSETLNYTKGYQPESAKALAKLCRDILFENALQAIDDMEKGNITNAFEKVVEANIFLSGIGFENNGCALAHATYNGLTEAISDLHIMHGEGVAYGTVLQLVTESFISDIWELNEFKKITELFHNIGLPVKLSDLNIESSDANIEKIAIEIVKTNNAKHMPFDVSVDLLKTTIKINEQLFDK